jgi:hypothetical protein
MGLSVYMYYKYVYLVVICRVVVWCGLCSQAGKRRGTRSHASQVPSSSPGFVGWRAKQLGGEIELEAVLSTAVERSAECTACACPTLQH